MMPSTPRSSSRVISSGSFTVNTCTGSRSACAAASRRASTNGRPPTRAGAWTHDAPRMRAPAARPAATTTPAGPNAGAQPRAERAAHGDDAPGRRTRRRRRGRRVLVRRITSIAGPMQRLDLTSMLTRTSGQAVRTSASSGIGSRPAIRARRTCVPRQLVDPPGADRSPDRGGRRGRPARRRPR